MGSLEGIRVCDLSQFEAGPSCTELLAFLGADVVKVEPPGRGDQGRSLGMGPGPDSWYFLVLNLNKRSITLNLKSGEGRELFRRMLPRFDVLVENFTLGTMEEWGLGWDALRDVHPGLVYASVRGFGDSGPYAQFRAFDMVAQASGGPMSVTGERDGVPMRLGITLGDTGTGVHLAAGILAALLERTRTGRGQRVEISMQEAMVNFTRVAMVTQYVTGEPVHRRGTALRAMSADLFRCAPGGPNDYVFTAISNRDMWEGVLRTVGRTDLVGDPEWSDAAWRARHWADVRAVIEEWTQRHEKTAVMEQMQANGVPCGAVFDTMDIVTNHHLRERRIIAKVDHPDAGTFEVPGNPVRLWDSPTEITRPPLLGEHNRELYPELLALDSAELVRLSKEGVI